MNQRHLARVFSLFAFLGISASFAVAQTPTPTPTPAPKKRSAAVHKTPPKRLVAPSPTPEPINPKAVEGYNLPKEPFRFKASYFGEYIGPRFSNFDFAHTETPSDKKPEWAYFNHYLKLGYLVSKDVTLGVQFRAVNSFDSIPDNAFYWEDIRLWASWAHMIETSDVDMTGIVKFEIPTTDWTRNMSEILAIKVEANWIIKTSLRNWHFSALTWVKPYFYSNPMNGGKGREDLDVAIEPYISMDLIPNVQLLFQGYFECSHNYVDNFYNFRSGDVDTINIGPLITINRHLNTNIAIRLYPDNLSLNDATLYLSITAVL